MHFSWEGCASPLRTSLLVPLSSDDGGQNTTWMKFKHPPIPRDLHYIPYKHSVTRFIQE